MAAIAIFAFQGAWHFMGPLIYLQSERLYTLQIGLRQCNALWWLTSMELADGG
ncbi:MAG: hypothetical protein R2867_34030 [Caldilineaceae bacterium]